MRTEDELSQELAGLDHLEVHDVGRASRIQRVWASLWPKLAAIGLVLAVWQFLYWREWRPSYSLPSPATVWQQLKDDLATAELWRAIWYTMRRALVGFGVALAVGGVLGILVSRWRVVRTAVGSLITGLQTMPSVAWFPLAILLFGLTERAILFVVVLGAAPSIANGIISGFDNVPPLLRRLGTSMGAGNVALYRDFVIPAAWPSTLAGLKQGWAFSWRSLMAGELLVIIPGTQSLGTRLQFARDFSDAPEMIAMMVVILVIGVLVDTFVFARLERSTLRKRGLIVDDQPAQKLVTQRELVTAATGQ